MSKNLNLSSRIGVIGSISPRSAGVGTLTTPWLDMQSLFTVMAVLAIGAFGANATVDAQIEQATDGNGAGAKPVPGSQITQLVAAGGNDRQAQIDLRQEDFDKNAGYRFFRLSVTVGGAATLLAASLVGADFRQGTGTRNVAASVAQTI
ncbi:hypothetical protein Q5H91_04120 [Sphingomonas sp. KR1UV-12]|uniref:Uncharacterized protein n=1 Tax=Sphingomonas aurea TaxID=3063994 RepID=A0ABT9EHE8_9SPHN|nr:hypothetical protein [Sphingomonas sp. KR1UV-12]MDP1026388.1 hypothetical protein [Sphingomonas sp. KR1UV-12]